MRCAIDWKVNLDPHGAFMLFLKRAQLTIQFHNLADSFERHFTRKNALGKLV